MRAYPRPPDAVEEADRPKVQAERPLKNWGRTFHFTPAVVVEARTYEDVIEAVKDTAKYPTPVRALGACVRLVGLVGLCGRFDSDHRDCGGVARPWTQATSTR